MKRPEQYFRAGVGAVIINGRKLVLALERADIPGAWQLPQGGLKASEDPLEAVKREVAEETGIRETELKLLDTHPGPLVYELPAEVRTKKTGRGQVQYWFLFRFRGTDAAIELQGGGEFRAWEWLPFNQLVDVVAEFRRAVYRQLARRFRRHFFEARSSGGAPAPAPPRSGAVGVGTEAAAARHARKRQGRPLPASL